MPDDNHETQRSLSPLSNANSSMVELPTGSLAPEQLQRLEKSLSRTTADFYYGEGGFVECEGTRLLANVAKKKRSCFVIGREGEGKGYAASLLEDGDDNGDLIVMPYQTTTMELLIELWYHQGYPVPWRASFLKHKTEASGDFAVYHCSYCAKKCEVWTTGKGLFHEFPSDADVRAVIVPKINDIADSTTCPLVIDMVYLKLEKAVQGKTIIVKVPFPVDEEFVRLCERLLVCCTVVLLATPEQQTHLCKRGSFRQLNAVRFPIPSGTVLLEVLRQRLEEADTDVSPLSIQAVALIALASNHNIGRFLRTIDNVLLQMEVEDATLSVDAPYVLKALTDIIDHDTVLNIVLATKSGYREVAEIRRTIQAGFGLTISEETLGNKLTEKGFQKRRVNGRAQYYIPPINLLEDKSKTEPVLGSLTQNSSVADVAVVGAPEAITEEGGGEPASECRKSGRTQLEFSSRCGGSRGVGPDYWKRGGR